MEAVWGHRLDRTGLALGLTGLTAPSAHATAVSAPAHTHPRTTRFAV